MKVVWSQSAIAQLQSVYDYIARDSERYALRMVDRLTKKSERLAGQPQSGHIVPEYDELAIREVLEGSYRIIYESTDESVTILAIIHGARRLPDIADRL